MERNSSLRGRLLRGLLPAVFLIIVASAVFPYLLALRPAESAFDRALGDGAYAIATIIRSLPPEQVVIDAQAEGAIRSDSVDTVLFAVLDPEGRLLAGDAALLLRPRAASQANPWIHTELVTGQPMRVFSLVAPCGRANCEIRIGETLRKRDALRRGTLLAAFLPEGALALFIVVFVALGVRRALAPLQAYSARLLQLGELGWQEMDPEETVAEVRPLIRALNRSAAALRSAAEAQQRFLSTAAHQLRTPLAGLKASADLAQLTTDPEQMHLQLAQVSRSADRVARLANQLLALARSDPRVQRPEELAPCDLAEICADLIEDSLRRAHAANIDLGFELNPAPLHGHPLLLRELLANLIDNALRYTPGGGRVTVRCGPAAHADGSTWLEVEDDGPGIPADMHESVLGRFVRLPGTPGEGSGLGLAIVKEICETHHARLQLLDSRASADPVRHGVDWRPGLRVRVEFADAPAVSPPPSPPLAARV
ncbi:MAG: sensor histidine kinase N-terminal domain-containing protein [Pseudomonadota bacterium]|nr:sensor histidine kinase N-terminal domain-containing protein [Pseudomonadota bacterium]